MKQFLLLPILLFFTVASSAQINKNNWIIGGNGSYTTHEYSSSTPFNIKYRTFQINADVGYLVIDKLAAGLRVTYFHDNQRGFSNDLSYFNQTNRNIHLAPFIRYYFLSKDRKYNLLADASYNFGRMKDKNLGGYSKGRSNGYSFAGGPVWFLNPHTALELTLKYEYAKEYFKTSSIKINVGFQIHLNKSKKSSTGKATTK